jgi:hypothetical protein
MLENEWKGGAGCIRGQSAEASQIEKVEKAPPSHAVIMLCLAHAPVTVNAFTRSQFEV